MWSFWCFWCSLQMDPSYQSFNKEVAAFTPGPSGLHESTTRGDQDVRHSSVFRQYWQQPDSPWRPQDEPPVCRYCPPVLPACHLVVPSYLQSEKINCKCANEKRHYCGFCTSFPFVVFLVSQDSRTGEPICRHSICYLIFIAERRGCKSGAVWAGSCEPRTEAVRGRGRWSRVRSEESELSRDVEWSSRLD